MTTAPVDESAIRTYLLFLEDPSKLIDQKEVSRLEASMQSAADPLDKLRAISRLQDMHSGGGESYRQAFIANAKAWAEANEIRIASFLELGVDEVTLRAAGFSTRGLGGQTPSPRRGRGRRTSTGRGQVRVEQVKEAVGQQKREFTLADVAAACGASPMTIRKAVDELVAAGQVERLGPTPNWSQPGRAPIVFRAATKRSRRPTA